ncbi:hypothetical protein [Streptomyces virginiae]|uniref:hypothetical protein n=1 Tax=Streptomyces virginiae TaxID=1961 RepID=UPI0033232F5E
MLIELHKLYQLAGTPGVRAISAEIQKRDDLSATMNRDLASQILSGRRWPTVKQLDSLVRVLANQAVVDLEEDVESLRFVALWTAAEQPFSNDPIEIYSADPVDRAFEEASATGRIFPIVELAMRRPPHAIIEMLDKLSGRGWGKFATDLLEELAGCLEVSRVPALASLLPPSFDAWAQSDASTFLEAFARRRSVGDVCELTDLLMRAGAKTHAGYIVKVVRDERDLFDTAKLFVVLHKGGYGWSVGGTWNLDDVWPNSLEDVLGLIAEFRALGCPEAVLTLLTRYGSGHSASHRWNLYQLLLEREMQDVAEMMAQSLMNAVSEREVAEFVSISASAGEGELASRVIKGVVSVRSRNSSSHFIQFLPAELVAIANEDRKRA